MSATSHKAAVRDLVVAATLWSTGGVLIKMVAWNALALAGTRSAVAALILILYYRRVHFHWSANLWGGAIGYALSVIFFVAGTKLGEAGNVIALQYTAPFYVALLAPYLLKERVTRADWAMIALALCGMGLLFAEKISLEGRLGDLCGLASGVSIAWFIICMRRQRHAAPVQSVILGNLLAMIIALPWMFSEPPQLLDWGLIIVLGIVQLGIPYALYARAIRHLGGIESALIPMFEPVLNPLWVFLVLGEAPRMIAGLGCALILVAVTVRVLLSARSAGT